MVVKILCVRILLPKRMILSCSGALCRQNCRAGDLVAVESVVAITWVDLSAKKMSKRPLAAFSASFLSAGSLTSPATMQLA